MVLPIDLFPSEIWTTTKTKTYVQNYLYILIRGGVLTKNISLKKYCSMDMRERCTNVELKELIGFVDIAETLKRKRIS